RSLRPGDSGHRAQHGAGDGHLRADFRPQLRQDDRPGDAGANPHEPGGDRSLPRGACSVSAMDMEHRLQPVGSPAKAGAPLLAVRDLEVAYGNIPALHGITLEVEKGEIVTLIGANGAGKTTTLRTISGLLKPRRGEVSFNDRRITGAKPNVITAM